MQEQEAQPPSCSLQCLDQEPVFKTHQRVDLTMEVHGNEEDAVRKAQATNVRHAPSATPPRTHGRKKNDRGYQDFQGAALPRQAYKIW